MMPNQYHLLFPQDFEPTTQEVPMDPQWMSALTCEQRKAIEYGIDKPSIYDPEADPKSRTPQHVSTVLSDPRPNGRDFICPVAFGCAFSEWEKRQEEDR